MPDIKSPRFPSPASGVSQDVVDLVLGVVKDLCSVAAGLLTHLAQVLAVHKGDEGHLQEKSESVSTIVYEQMKELS